MSVFHKLGLLALLSHVIATAADSFSAEDMLSAPRPHAAIASPDGHHAISLVDRWDPKEDLTTRSVYLLSLDTTSSASPIALFSLPPAHASEFLWLNDHTPAFLNGSTLYSFHINNTARDSVEKGVERQKVLQFPEGINPTGLQYQRDANLLFFSGQVWPDGDFATVEKKNEMYEKRGTSGVVYDELFIRHWDTWRTPGKAWTIGATHLNLTDAKSSSSSPKVEFVNMLNSTRFTSQSDPHGSVAISSTHLAFTMKPSHLNFATHTREDVYTIPLDHYHHEPKLLTPKDHGAISSLKFSPNGKRLAWLEMAEDGYESDKRVIVVHEMAKKGNGKTERWTEDWDRSPSEIEWSLDSDSLYFVAEHEGRILPYHLTHAGHLPTPLIFEHSTSSITPLTSDSLLLSVASFTSPADEYILDLSLKATGDGDKLPNRKLRQLTSWSSHHIAGRLDNLEIEELWFKGADEWDVMAWVIKPPGFNSTDKPSSYPLAFFVHGGPQGSWEDTWSTRWNPALFAANGYFVVAVNPTGSTGYGQEFCDKIKENWGGAPYKDLLAGFFAALNKYPQIDRERTAMLGASYGGYMANWIQGHNDEFRFKAIVCHDGIFDTTSAFYETEEVWFPKREFGGDPTQVRAMFEKWNPMNHVSEWKTPELVIHGGRDYRLVDGQGIAAFTALQVQGVPSRFLYFPDENHWVLKASNSMKWHHEVFRWLKEWTGEKNADADADEVPRLVIQA